jgi:hypothetical protein
MFNKAGKTLTIFIILTFILLLSSTCIGFYLYHLEERLHKSVETDLDASRANEQKLQGQLKDVQGQLALAEDKNKEADQKINSLLDEQDLNEGLRTALKKENAALKEQMANINQSKQKIKAELNDADSKLSQYQELLKASEDKSKALEASLASLTETNKNMTDKVAQLNGDDDTGKDKMELGKIVVDPQDGTKGHILSVDTDAEFVVFNLGLSQGVKSNDIFSVYRGNEYLGDIKATRVQDAMSAADIIPPLSSTEIHKNDTVVLKP